MNRAAKLEAYLDDLCDRASWLALTRLNLDGVDLDTFPTRMREHADRTRRYADELQRLADECTNAIDSLESETPMNDDSNSMPNPFALERAANLLYSQVGYLRGLRPLSKYEADDVDREARDFDDVARWLVNLANANAIGALEKP